MTATTWATVISVGPAIYTMIFFIWLVIIVAVYFFLVFVVLRLVVPFMGFRKPALPINLPEEIKDRITELENVSVNQPQYLQAAYNFVSGRWQAGRMSTVFYAPLAFRADILEIWRKPGYAHCNTQNYLLFILLTESKYFKPDDIIFHYNFFNFFIHQYLTVKVGAEWVAADPAGASIRGAGLGTHISLFG